ncbi:MAG: hypothetical protein H6Q20_2030 [Bacteroidetes bacterium]|nr:hypothetical protein [Bacteroidota bacterium]
MLNNNTDNEHDKLNEIFRQKLEHHTLPADDEVWDGIQAELKKRKKKKIFPLGWVYAGTAAAVLLLFFTINNFMKRQTEYETLAAKTEETFNKISDKQQFEITENQNHEKQTASRKTLALNTVTNNGKSILHTPTDHANEQTGATTPEPENNAADAANPATKTIEKTGTDTQVQKSKPETTDLKAKDWEDPVKKQKKRGWEVAAALSSSGSSSVNAPALMSNSENLKMSVSRAPAFSSAALSSDEFTGKSYSAPLSVGISVAKSISDHLSIRTGITYTYLQTKLENINYNADLALHYLGVPLNLQAYLIKSGKWGLYLSGGGMLEKGIRSVETKEQYISNKTITTTTYGSIDGWQWSVNGAIGTTYDLYKGINLYLEPKVSYYFDNDQPISIRTERKTVLGIEGGIRFNF